jgi:uncharacterized membrane protein
MLVAFVAGFVVWAAARAAAGDVWGVVIALAFGSPFAYALVNGWIRWRRGTLRRGERFRDPGDAG